MYNLHCHSLLSDGVLLPSEIAVRHAALGYKAIAIADHADYSNIERIVNSILEFTNHWPKNSLIKVFSGVELTHLPAEQFKPLAKYAREQGIKIIIGHGETLIEPVIKGTNRAALEADIDILAHPGLITDEDVKLAEEKGIFLELTSRKGHSTTNNHVVEKAQKIGARLILNIDSHLPEDIISPDELMKVAQAAGLNQSEIEKIYQDTERFLSRKEGR
jgi:histidinol phosphatase-like PHP family hydrolase